MPDSPFASMFKDGPSPLREFPLEGLIESEGMESIHGEPVRKTNCAKCGGPIQAQYRIRYNLCTKCLKVEPPIKTRTTTNDG